MIAIANVFPKLQTVKFLVRPLSKKRRFRTRLDSEHVQATQILGKSPWQLFCHAFLSLLGKLSWNISSIVLGEILEMFVNTLTVDGKYPVQRCENLQLPIQRQLYENQKIFSEFFASFLDPRSSFECFERKDDRHSSCISEITDCENLC